MLNLHVHSTFISSYQIYDKLGRIVYAEEVNNLKLVKVDISNLNIGNYFVKVITPLGKR